MTLDFGFNVASDTDPSVLHGDTLGTGLNPTTFGLDQTPFGRASAGYLDHIQEGSLWENRPSESTVMHLETLEKGAYPVVTHASSSGFVFCVAFGNLFSTLFKYTIYI